MGKKPVAPGGDTGPNTIFKATYSGVPVYEMICRNVAVMRRRSDGYLNATQILKVAGFDKPQRTRVLEREVQKGEHEKVQGGYGKYQGTWIPIERGLALSKQYGVEDLLRPIIDYVPTSVSPPPAPKHIVAPPTKTKKDKDGKPIKESATPTKTGPMSAAALQAQAQLAAQRAAAAQQAGAAGPGPSSSSPTQEDRTRDGDESLSETPNEDDDSSETPSPIASGAELPVDAMDLDGAPGSSRKRTAQMMLEDDVDPYMSLQRARGHSAVHTPRSSPPPLPDLGLVGEGPARYRDHILNYFISETSTIPQFLITPPTDFNPDMTIDDDGHTPLHWACAMGRVRVVKLLLSGGASIFAANNMEQTPLMRSVMFSNNYDMRKFAEIYELLHRSTLNIDKQNRTVFHHIANLALNKGKTHAARYYMETILSRLSDYPQELADVINFQDEEGETALTLAARARSKRLVKALLDHGADPKVRNRDFKSAEEYILEDERFRSSPVQGEKSNGWGSSFKNDQPVQLFYSEAARMAGGDLLGDLVSNVQSLARSIESEYQSKERDILQAKATLTTTHAEITETTKLIESLTAQVAPFEERKREYETLQANLKSKVKEVLKQGWETWLAGESIRESRWKGGERGEDLSDLEATLAPAGDGEEERLRWEIEEKRRRSEELVKAFVTAQAEAGTGEKISKYRQLISASSGGSIAPGDVDGVMAQLLEMLENENETLGQPAAPGAGLHMPVGVGVGMGVGVGVGVGGGMGNGHAGQWMAQA